MANNNDEPIIYPADDEPDFKPDGSNNPPSIDRFQYLRSPTIKPKVNSITRYIYDSSERLIDIIEEQ